jgi:hypothetical protein
MVYIIGGYNRLHNLVILKEHPSSTTLAHFVGSVLSHSLNMVFVASLHAQIRLWRTSQTPITLSEMYLPNPVVPNTPTSEVIYKAYFSSKIGEKKNVPRCADIG